jgi:two-component system, NarL family, nitrate/nitrite response regulator NarL
VSRRKVPHSRCGQDPELKRGVRPRGEPIGILVVSDVRLYRESLVRTLARRRRLRVAGSAHTPAQALMLARSGIPSVLLIDARFPAGSSLVRDLAQVAPDIRTVVLGISESVCDVIAWAEAGVSGYLAPDARVDELVTAVERVAHGETVCTPEVAAALARHVAALSRRSDPGESRLTRRETQIISLIDRGLSNKEIARDLGIEISTVKNHLHNVFEKLRVRRRAEAAAFVREMRAPLVGAASSAVAGLEPPTMH